MSGVYNSHDPIGHHKPMIIAKFHAVTSRLLVINSTLKELKA